MSVPEDGKVGDWVAVKDSNPANRVSQWGHAAKLGRPGVLAPLGRRARRGASDLAGPALDVEQQPGCAGIRQRVRRRAGLGQHQRTVVKARFFSKSR
jgi:hypothetical protein